MTNEEKLALKVACLQAAATMVAQPGKINMDCARIAKQIYDRVVKIDWEKEGVD
jgi:hypothetical protein